MAKKAQGMSVNVIIIAALALLVLVILSIIFLGRMGIFTGSIKECEKNGGICTTSACGEGDAEDYPTPYRAWVCLGSDGKPDPSMNCCIKISAT